METRRRRQFTEEELEASLEANDRPLTKFEQFLIEGFALVIISDGEDE